MQAYRDAAAIAALDAEAAVLLELFAAHGYRREEPAILQPAGMFLDRSGEEIRRRTFTLIDPAGRELCLRPDLTIPICKHAVETGAPLPARLCYHGAAFRYEPSGRPAQFFQSGVELLGLGDRVAGDAEILTIAVEAVREAGLAEFSLRIGDVALFGALVDALDLPPHWRARLKRHFWRAGAVETLLDRIDRGQEGSHLPRTRDGIEDLLDEQRDAPSAGRSRAEIIARAEAEAAEVLRLDGNVAGAITRLLAISGPADEALADVRALLKTAGIRLEPQVAAVEARLGTLASLGVEPARVEFVAHFGRNMEYYTGFVFDVWANCQSRAIEVAGGGRYDHLLEWLGAGQTVSAVGCAIRTEELFAAAQLAKDAA